MPSVALLLLLLLLGEDSIAPSDVVMMMLMLTVPAAVPASGVVLTASVFRSRAMVREGEKRCRYIRQSDLGETVT